MCWVRRFEFPKLMSRSSFLLPKLGGDRSALLYVRARNAGLRPAYLAGARHPTAVGWLRVRRRSKVRPTRMISLASRARYFVLPAYLLATACSSNSEARDGC